MIVIRAVSDETMNRAKSLTEILGLRWCRAGFDGEAEVMDDVLDRRTIDGTRQLYVAELSRQAIEDAGADHLGFGGYFIYETCDDAGRKGIYVLGKASSFEAALRIVELWDANAS